MTPFQARVLGLVHERLRDEAERDARANEGTPASGRHNRGAVRGGGGGGDRQVTRFRNLSAETGKSPEQLIAEHNS